jgi:hypothetical protein
MHRNMACLICNGNDRLVYRNGVQASRDANVLNACIVYTLQSPYGCLCLGCKLKKCPKRSEKDLFPYASPNPKTTGGWTDYFFFQQH